MLNLSPQDICGTNISQLRGRTDKPHICKNSCGEWTVNSVDIIHLIGYDLRQRQPLPALKWQAANASAISAWVCAGKV